MRTFEQMGVKVPEILLPKNMDVETWAVVACDQYTQDREYWENVKKSVSDKPSSLNVILPEVYLNDSDKEERIEKIQNTMRKYIESGIFDFPESEMIYVERRTAYGRTRRGLVTSIDLETYEWKPFSNSLIRATEATIVERIPPRMKIRDGAALEIPHIMLLVNDEAHILVEGIGNLVKKDSPCYSGKLMQKSGEISGWSVKSPENLEKVRSSLETLFEKNTAPDGSTFLFAVGDGNHSLATAKAVWEEYKKLHPDADDTCPVRYALVEIVNIYDEGLTFEPIHRVVFCKSPQKIIDGLANRLNGKLIECETWEELSKKVRTSSADFGFVYTQNGTEKFFLLSTEIKELAVSCFQPALDENLKIEKGTDSSVELDYIHGENEVLRLGKKENALGILLPPVQKESFFSTIAKSGPLPRKSFSMGEADEKRFYLESRKLFS